MHIRPLEIADIAIVRMKGEALAAALYPEMIPAIDREHELLRQMCLDTSHYSKVVGTPGAPKAALIARSGDNLWAIRRHATILLWYSEVPGAGAALLRDFRDWVKTQKSMVLAGFMDDFGIDERMKNLVQRVGFEQRGGAYVFFPRGAKTKDSPVQTAGGMKQ